MIINQNGRYYLAFHETTTLADIVGYQNHLIELLKVASTAEIFEHAEDTVFTVCSLLHELNLTQYQGHHLGYTDCPQAFDPEVLEKVTNRSFHNR